MQCLEVLDDTETFFSCRMVAARRCERLIVFLQSVQAADEVTATATAEKRQQYEQRLKQEDARLQKEKRLNGLTFEQLFGADAVKTIKDEAQLSAPQLLIQGFFLFPTAGLLCALGLTGFVLLARKYFDPKSSNSISVNQVLIFFLMFGAGARIK